VSMIDPYGQRSDYGPWRWLHRLNPLGKAFAPLPFMVLLIFTRDIATPFAFLALGLTIVLAGAHLNRTTVAIVLGLPVLVVVMTFTFGLWARPELVEHTPALLTIGGYTLYLGSLEIGLATALRLTALVSLTLIGGLTTTGPDLVRSMIQHLKVPYRIGYTALAAYRFVPRFGHELQVIRSAHRVRGMAGGRGPIAATQRTLGYVVPLLAGAIRHAERVAMAMDSRAFGAYRTRTERHLIPFRARDWVFIVAFITASLAILVATTPFNQL